MLRSWARFQQLPLGGYQTVREDHLARRLVSVAQVSRTRSRWQSASPAASIRVVWPAPPSAHSTRIPASLDADLLAASAPPTGACRITLGCYRPQLRTAGPACPRASALAPTRRPSATCRSRARLAVLFPVGAPACRPGVLRRRPRMGIASGASMRGGSAVPQPEYHQHQARKRYQRPYYLIGVVV